MFNFLINIPASLYAFLSGILISISTTAVGNILLTETPPANKNDLLIIGIITLFSSFLWLFASERVTAINLSIERNAASFPGDSWSKRQNALRAVKKDSAHSLYAVVFASIIFSIGWLYPLL